MLGEIVKATINHAVRMAPHVRAAEIREIMDSHGMDPQPALIAELERSESSWAWIVGGEVACMFGVVRPSYLADESYPWFLSTSLVESNKMQFARACRALLPEILERHPKLCGMVDARYELSVRWLRWLGANVMKPEPWGIAGELFHRFEIGG